MGQIATVTIGADTFSVYAITTDAVADATTYFNGQLGSAATAWTAATSDNKKRALVMAAVWMDRAVKFSGEKTSAAQPRAWPRDGASCNAEPIADGTVPDALAYAEFVLAGILLQDASAADSAGTGSNVKSVQAGSASVSFFTATAGTASDTRLPITAWDFIKCLSAGAATTIGQGMASGADQDTGFCSSDAERSDGYS